MEKRIVKKPVYKTVEDGFMEVTEYVASDGRVFSDNVKCQVYDSKLVAIERFNKKYSYSQIDIDQRYEVICIPELTKDIIREIEGRWYNILRSNLRTGINLIHTDDSGDYTSHTVHHPEDMISERLREVDILNSLISRCSTTNTVIDLNCKQVPMQ